MTQLFTSLLANSQKFFAALIQLTRRAKELDPPDRYHARRRRKRSGMGDMGGAENFLIMISKLDCKRCSHEWVPRVEKPAKCPRCKSYDYQVPKREKA